jgi:hypothetical protein
MRPQPRSIPTINLGRHLPYYREATVQDNKEKVPSGERRGY